MNFSLHLLEFLKKQGKASVSNFGTFFLKNTSATLDEGGKNILPPGKEIAFSNQTLENEKDFIQHLSDQEKITLLEAEIEIRKQVTFWNTKLEKDGSVKIENFGTFFLNDSILQFKGDKAETISADFYGLEEINLLEIKKSSNNRSSEKNYRFSKAIYWLIPLLVALGVLSYFAVTQPEKIFGAASFLKSPKAKAKTDSIKSPVKKDSIAVLNPLSDSLKIDSAKKVNPTPTTPNKKWSSKK